MISKYIDHTLLKANTTEDDIKSLCQEAINYKFKSVCVNPTHVRIAKELLSESDVLVCTVIGFPLGANTTGTKVFETVNAVSNGADEIDMVISRGKFLNGDYIEVFDEIHSIREICSKVHLKVILETGEIGDLNAVFDASMIAMKAGADFIKTSTGKIAQAASPEVAYVMLSAIRQFYEKTGKIVGFKPAGGISSPEQAIIYIKLVESILGPQWLSKDLLRIGASRLATNIVERLNALRY